ncbi:DUF1759 domain-containing protein, partial [Providencia rettgeri]
SNISAPSSKIKLPKLELKKYGGDLLEFNAFWQTFQNAVHNNNSLTDVEKFCYLKNTLVGDAENCIAGLSVTNENYDIAITLL